MSACERCWDAAFFRSRRLGGFQADHYRDLLAENPDGHNEATPDPMAALRESLGLDPFEPTDAAEGDS